jgi:hypothetical protein
MALATAAILWRCRDTGGYATKRFKIKAATQLYEGQYVQLDTNGELIPYDADNAGTGNAGARTVGRVLPTKKDRESATYLLGDSTTPRPEAIVMIGSEILENVAVAGATDDTHRGELVYLDAANTQGDRVLTLTSTNNGKPLGVVVGYRGSSGSTECDVLVYSFAERLAQ